MPSGKWEYIFDQKKYMADYQPVHPDLVVSHSSCCKVRGFVRAMQDTAQARRRVNLAGPHIK